MYWTFCPSASCKTRYGKYLWKLKSATTAIRTKPSKLNVTYAIQTANLSLCFP